MDNYYLYMSNEQEDMAWAKAHELDGKEYDLVGLASFGTDWNIIKEDPDKYWCSETCAELIKAAYAYGANQALLQAGVGTQEAEATAIKLAEDSAGMHPALGLLLTEQVPEAETNKTAGALARALLGK